MEPVVVGGQDLPDLAQSEDWDPAAVRSQGEVGPAILTDPPRSFPVLSGSFRFILVHYGLHLLHGLLPESTASFLVLKVTMFEDLILST